MEEELVTYFDFAENDYKFLKATYENGFLANTMAAIAQGICEKYLKFVIEKFADSSRAQYESIMKTHSIRKLLRYIEHELPGFVCDEDAIKKVDGYYFNTRYPGDESITINKKDLDECMKAADACREAVVRYLGLHTQELETEKEQMQENKNRNIRRGR